MKRRNFITAGYWDWSLYTFGIWASHRDGDHSSSDKLPLGFGLGFRELQSVQLQKNRGWKRHAKAILTGHQLCCSYIFLIWASHGDQNLSPSDKMPLCLELGSREKKDLEFQGHWGWKMHNKIIIVGAQHFCPHTLQIRAINGDGHLSCSPKIAKRLVWKKRNSEMKWKQKNRMEWTRMTETLWNDTPWNCEIFFHEMKNFY